MPKAHFTYLVDQSPPDLQQGDVLRRTERLINLIEDYHKYYLRDNYLAFSVLTQSWPGESAQIDKWIFCLTAA